MGTTLTPTKELLVTTAATGGLEVVLQRVAGVPDSVIERSIGAAGEINYEHFYYIGPAPELNDFVWHEEKCSIFTPRYKAEENDQEPVTAVLIDGDAYWAVYREPHFLALAKHRATLPPQKKRSLVKQLLAKAFAWE